MGLFRPYDKAAKATSPATDGDSSPAGGAPKNRPTPTREQAQAARMQALHPKLTKRQAAAQERAASEKRRVQQMEAIDNRPERVLMRNYVDSRRSAAEFTLPAMLLLLVASLVIGGHPVLLLIVWAIVWALLIVAIVSIWWFWQGYKRELAARHPSASTKGMMTQLASRLVMFRRMRVPAPTVKVGEPY